MQQVTVEELINYKILPFDIYSGENELLFSAGDVITPGKFLQLRHMDGLYREDDETRSFVETAENVPDDISKESTAKKHTKPFFGIDQIDISKVKTSINKRSKIPPVEQVKIKTYYDKLLEKSYTAKPVGVIDMYGSIRDKIVGDYTNIFNNTVYPSQLRLLGEYEKCHALNVAILAACLSHRLNKSEEFTADLILAALLHDIGKNHIPPVILMKQSLSSHEQKILNEHSTLGYNIIKNELGLGENIARAALEHHENNDGSGYPKGRSGDKISLEGRIISVCNFFDNLTFNRTTHKVKNGRDALRIMLEKGSDYFATDILYTFVYMFNYDDTIAFEEMVL